MFIYNALYPILDTAEVRCVGVHPLYRILSRRGLLDHIKLAYDPRCRKAGS